MLVCTSWPRMEAEPLLGGKRPLKMDLWGHGSEKWPFVGRTATCTLRDLLHAQAVCCKLVLLFTGKGRSPGNSIASAYCVSRPTVCLDPVPTSTAHLGIPQL